MKQIAVIGQASISDSEKDISEFSFKAGQIIAQHNLVLLNGGLTGVMEYSAAGCKESGGTTVGILPGNSNKDANCHIDYRIATNMGHARNIIIITSADIILAIGGSHGTLIEISTALKLKKPIAGYKTWDISGVNKVNNIKQFEEWIQEIIN